MQLRLLHELIFKVSYCAANIFTNIFNLDVPNNKITTIAKMTTCQIDKPAIILYLFLVRFISTGCHDKNVTLIFHFKTIFISRHL